MDWIEIKKKYSSAYKDFFKYSNKQSPQKYYRGNLFPADEHLYDFFDELEIFVHCYNTETSKWYWEIDEYGAECIKDYKTRKEAEQVAFLKAFEILEEK